MHIVEEGYLLFHLLQVSMSFMLTTSFSVVYYTIIVFDISIDKFLNYYFINHNSTNSYKNDSINSAANSQNNRKTYHNA